MLPTIIDAGRVQTFERLYPFDFFGFIRIGTPQLLEQWQWVFDRSAGGRLVRFLRLPDQIRSHPPEQCEAVRPAESMGCHLKLGGYHRVSSGDIHVPLLLNVIQMRWWPDLFVQDDWKRFENIKALIMKYGLTEILLDESLSFGACLEALSVEHNRRNEP